MTECITYEIMDSHIARITLNRLNAMNAMSIALLDELNNTITNIKADENIRTVIITGAGEKAFCAGADLKERKNMTNNEVISTVNYIGQTMNQVEQLSVPVIAAINGAAFGGGLELALASDIRISARHAKMGLTETSLAIIPGAGGTQRLPRLIGLGQAKKLIFTATPVEAEDALTIGLVEDVVETKDLQNCALALAKNIARNGPVAVKQAKSAINKGVQADLYTGLAIEHLCYQQTIQTEDRIEGLQAFKEKRKPLYKGK